MVSVCFFSIQEGMEHGFYVDLSKEALLQLLLERGTGLQTDAKTFQRNISFCFLFCFLFCFFVILQTTINSLYAQNPNCLTNAT